MNDVFKINDFWKENALVDRKIYDSMYQDSIENNDKFWKKHGKRIDWIKPYTKIKDFKYSNKNAHIKWYYDGTLNVSYNCIDRHASINPDKIAIIWEGDDPTESKKISYKELLENVCKFANTLKKIGIKKLKAVVMAGNESSKKIFIKNNYKLRYQSFEKELLL